MTADVAAKVPVGLRALLRGVFDYAGTFPPAELAIEDAVRMYEAAGRSEYGWMLGRFVVAERDVASVPEDFDSTLAVVLSGGGSGDGSGAMNRAAAFETKSVFKSPKPSYCEVPVERLEDVASAGSMAKLRTTGLRGDEIVAYLTACAARRLPLKATAGLHFALRNEEHYGFLNVLLAACFVWLGRPADDARRVLDETDADGFRFNEAGVAWRDRIVLVDEIAATRRDFFHSIGSCSFGDPVESLRTLHWL